MDCQAMSRDQLIEKYLNERLDPAMQDELETHILECSRCAQTLEVLQFARADLTQRAHEIRAQTPRWYFGFRWQPIAVALVVLMAMGVGVQHFWKIKHPASAVTLQPQAKVNTAAAALSEQPGGKGASQPPSGMQTPPPLRPEHEQKPQRAKLKSNNTQGESVAASSGAQIEGTKTASVTPAPASDKLPPSGDSDALNVSNRKPVATAASAQPKLTTEQGVELYRLGMVEAPPYAFPGLAAKGKLPGAGKTSSYSSTGAPQDTGRIMFQNAMNAYIDGRYIEATGYLENAVKLEPKVADINFYLGVCRLLQGHPEDSVGPLKNAAAAGNSPYLQSSHYYLAKAYVQSHRFADAENEFREAIAVPGRLTADAKALLARLQVLRTQIDKQ